MCQLSTAASAPHITPASRKTRAPGSEDTISACANLIRGVTARGVAAVHALDRPTSGTDVHLCRPFLTATCDGLSHLSSAPGYTAYPSAPYRYPTEAVVSLCRNLAGVRVTLPSILPSTLPSILPSIPSHLDAHPWMDGGGVLLLHDDPMMPLPERMFYHAQCVLLAMPATRSAILRLRSLQVMGIPPSVCQECQATKASANQINVV